MCPILKGRDARFFERGGLKMYKCTNPRCDWTGYWCGLEEEKEYAGEYQGYDVYMSSKVCPRCHQEVEYTGDWSEE